LLLYYITDRTQFPGSEQQRRDRLLATITEAEQSGVDFIQLREKDLCSRDLEVLARDVITTLRSCGAKTRILINSRSDVALAAGAHGVHLRSDDISPADVRRIWRAATGKEDAVIAVSCHNEAEVIAAAHSGADFAVFGPIFQKNAAPLVPAAGLAGLGSACRHSIPVIALGGITVENAALCVQAGAAGIAGIRFFQQSKVAETVARVLA
jgi:thiamine-phosphate pyrophosphorylase